MKTVTKRELNQQTAKVLAVVDAGETVVVTERGVPRWRIESAREPDDPIARLEARGQITRAKEHPAPWPDDGAVLNPERVDALYRWSRGDH
ncbi:MAG TPA: hypothetical protein VF288_13035 [Mycobacteriales bacterium]